MHLPYAKFRLPTGGAGLPAMMHRNKIAKSVREWAEPKDIKVEFETEGYTLNVRFESKEDLMMFKLSYNTNLEPFCSYKIFYY